MLLFFVVIYFIPSLERSLTSMYVLHYIIFPSGTQEQNTTSRWYVCRSRGVIKLLSQLEIFQTKGEVLLCPLDTIIIIIIITTSQQRTVHFVRLTMPVDGHMQVPRAAGRQGSHAQPAGLKDPQFTHVFCGLETWRLFPSTTHHIVDVQNHGFSAAHVAGQ